MFDALCVLGEDCSCLGIMTSIIAPEIANTSAIKCGQPKGSFKIHTARIAVTAGPRPPKALVRPGPIREIASDMAKAGIAVQKIARKIP